MRFTTSIFMLICAVCAVISAYFIGHGLVVGEAWPWLTALALLAIAAVSGVVYVRMARNDPEPAAHHAHGHGHGHGHHQVGGERH